MTELGIGYLGGESHGVCHSLDAHYHLLQAHWKLIEVLYLCVQDPNSEQYYLLVYGGN